MTGARQDVNGEDRVEHADRWFVRGLNFGIGFTLAQLIVAIAVALVVAVLRAHG